MRSKYFFLTAPLILIVLLFNGCNILSWTSGENLETLINEGKRQMRDADYDAAANSFAAAIAEDPYNSTALYLHAKATVHGSGFNALNLADIISESTFSTGDVLPFTGTDWPFIRADLLFQTMSTVHSDLRLIIQDSTHGDFDSVDVDLDYGLASGFKGILGFQDSDANGIIDASDFPLAVTYSADNGTAFEINNLLGYFDSFVNPAKKIVVGKIASPEQIPQEYIDQFNEWVDNIETLLNEAMEIIIALLEDSELDLADIQETLDKIVNVAHIYRVDDGLDNDGDGRIDEEIIDGLDNDGDGWIDEDSDGRIDLDYL